MDSETEIEQQACKFEHILSPEATDKICTFLGHPKTCPHGAPIPPGKCCGKSSDEMPTGDRIEFHKKGF
jgi:Mn-dependent DtxR family transcriptional regulator